MSEKYAFVMMIKDEWWKEFRRRHHQGKTFHSYVRVGAAPPKNASLIVFYLTKPAGKLVGYGEFVERKVGNADAVWKEYGHESALKSKEKYVEFIGGKEKVSFIRFKNLRDATKPMTLNSILMLLGVKRLSRKGFYISKETSDELVSRLE